MQPPDSAHEPEEDGIALQSTREEDPWTWSAIWHRLSKSPRLRRMYLHVPGVLSLDTYFEPRLMGHPISRPETGLIGEVLAARWLRQHQRKILYRNYRGPHRGEVDIVARHGEVLTFIEVKTRRSAAFGRPADAVTLEKQRLIQRGAQDWLRLLGKPRIAFRFDIVEVLLISGAVPKVQVIQNAFTLPDAAVTGR